MSDMRKNLFLLLIAGVLMWIVSEVVLRNFFQLEGIRNQRDPLLGWILKPKNVSQGTSRRAKHDTGTMDVHI